MGLFKSYYPLVSFFRCMFMLFLEYAFSKNTLTQQPSSPKSQQQKLIIKATTALIGKFNVSNFTVMVN